MDIVGISLRQQNVLKICPIKSLQSLQEFSTTSYGILAKNEWKFDYFSHCDVCQTSLFLRFSVLSMQFPLKSWRTAKSTTKIMLSGVPFAFLFLRSMALKCSAEYGPIKRWLRHILVNSQFGYVCSTVNEKWAKNTGVSKRRRHYSYYTM